jgi:hypothetical protein
MSMNDHAMSELMGYTVLVAVVSIAAVGLMAGSMSSISSTEKLMELAGSASALESFAGLADSAVETNNTFYTACEMAVPSGCELDVLDKHDDFRSLAIYSGSDQLAFLPLGSVVIRSPFRSASYEGGAVLSNDSGDVAMGKTPSIRIVDAGSGNKALYVSVTSVSCDSSVSRSGPATLYVKCSSVEPMSWHVPEGSALTLLVRSGEPDAWKEQLENCGFSVSYEDGEVKATSEEVTDVYVVYGEVGVKTAGR